MNTSLINKNISKEESIATLVLLGWKLILPNVLLKPLNFNFSVSIFIKENETFVFINDITSKVESMDTVILDSDNMFIYSPSTIIQVVLDNTNGNINKNK